MDVLLHHSFDACCVTRSGPHVLTFPHDAADQWMETDENADVVNVLVTTGQLVPTLGKLLLFKLDGAFKATCRVPVMHPVVMSACFNAFASSFLMVCVVLALSCRHVCLCPTEPE